MTEQIISGHHTNNRRVNIYWAASRLLSVFIAIYSGCGWLLIELWGMKDNFRYKPPNGISDVSDRVSWEQGHIVFKVMISEWF